MTLVQKDVFFDSVKNGSNTQYNIFGFMKLPKIDVAKFKESHIEVIQTHDVFKTYIIEDNGVPYQIKNGELDSNINLVDFSDKLNPEFDFSELLLSVKNYELPITYKKLYEVWLVKINENDYRFVILFHHILMDGIGVNNWLTKLCEIYNYGVSESQDPSMSTIVEFDFEYINSSRYLRDEKFWINEVAYVPEPVFTPFYKNNFKKGLVPSKTTKFTINGRTHENLKSLADNISMSVQQIYLSIIAVFSFRFYANKQFFIGCPTHNRTSAVEKSKVGMFTSILPIRVIPNRGKTFVNFAKDVKASVSRSFRYQKYPHSKILKSLADYSGGDKVYEIGFNYQTKEITTFVEGSVVEIIGLSNGLDQTPLQFNFWESDSLEVRLEFNQSYFSISDIKEIRDDFLNLVDFICNSPNEVIEFYDKRERAISRSGIGINEYLEGNISDIIERTAEKNGDKVAVYSFGVNYSYKDLWEDINKKIEVLKVNYGLSSGKRVAVQLNPSIELISWMIAIFKSRLIYVPIDPSYPVERVDFILKDSTSSLKVSSSGIEEINSNYSDFSKDESFFIDNAAYIIYTSGSTGVPKGVIGSHDSLVNRISWFEKQYPTLPDDVFSFKTSVSFVDHLAEVLQPLVAGNELIVLSKEELLSPFELKKIIQRKKVSRLTLVPSFLQSLIDTSTLEYLKTLRIVISSGEQLGIDQARMFFQALPTTKLINLYGSSETGGDSTFHEVSGYESNRSVMNYFFEDQHGEGLFNISKDAFSSKKCIDTDEGFKGSFSDTIISEEGIPFQEFINDLNERVIPNSIDVSDKKYIGHMTSKLPSYIPELSKLISKLNQNMVKVETSNSFTLIERQVLAMMHRLFYDHPNEFYLESQNPNFVYGAVTSGGSVANLTSLTYARNNALMKLGVAEYDIRSDGFYYWLNKLGLPRAVVLGTDLMHYSIRKSLSLMGLGENSIIYIDKDKDGRMSIDSLNSAIEECRRDNILIIAIVGISGATETGTVDPLSEIARVASRENIHFHADAAWGGAFKLSQNNKHRLIGIDQADTITFCPHKMLYISQGISLCLFKDPTSASSIATYANYQSNKGSFDLGQYTIEGSRPAQSLLLYSSLKILGLKGYSWLIDRSVHLTNFLVRLIETTDAFELVGKPDLNIVNYRYIPISLRFKKNYSKDEVEQINEATKKIQKIQFQRNNTFSSKTSLSIEGRVNWVFRVVLSNPLTTTDDIIELINEQIFISSEYIERNQDCYDNLLCLIDNESFESLGGFNAPIGSSIDNVETYVLDENLQVVPYGQIGELYISGQSLALGYLNNPSLQREVFLDNPFYIKGEPSFFKKMFRTGDLVRRVSNGVLECFGRTDDQVKIRGQRVDLNEIKSCLLTFDFVKDACVKFDSNGIQVFVVYNDFYQHQDLLRLISKKLPSYMLPNGVLPVSEIPLLPNGKVNKRALVLPVDQVYVTDGIANNTTQEVLFKIWSEDLSLPVKSIYDDFFSLGGDSIKISKLLGMISEEFSVKLSIRDFFENASIYEVASVIDNALLTSSRGLDAEVELEDGFF
nr:aminotransferase class V-fold PLP-dependent enzyme [Motilimonas sp. E26]